MSLENIARLFVGIGFLWIALVLLVAVLGGFDQPTTLTRLLAETIGSEIPRHVFLVLSLLVTPVGMLTFLRDILGDPVARWAKWAAPGGFVALYALFLAAAVPDAGRPFLLAFDAVTPVEGLQGSPDTTGSWLLRFVAAFAILAGVPGAIGAVVGLAGGSGRRR